MEFIEYTIGELALEIKTGKTPPTSNPEYFDGQVNWLTPSDFRGQKTVEETKRKLSQLSLEHKKVSLYETGTVVITTKGDVGKSILVKEPLTGNDQLTGVLVNQNIILPELFFYWVQGNKKLLENKANKSVISILNNKLLRRIKVVFPKDFQNQYKIVGRLNRIQELIDKRVETVESLNKYIRSVFLEMFLEKSRNWEYKSIKESKGVKNRIQGVGKKSNSSGRGKPMLRMNNLTYFGEIDLNDLKWFELSAKEEKTFHLENRNVLFNRTNSPELVGKIAVWNQGTGYTFAGYLVKLELDESILNPYYFSSFFNSDFGKMVLRNKARLSGNLANISGSKFLEQLILLPPIELQAKYEKTYLKFQEIKTQLEKQQEFLQILFQAYLQDSFKDEEIDEDEVFETLLQNFTKEDLKQGNRLKYLLKWIDCKEPRFYKFESYNLAWDRLRELLEDGSIKQVLDKNEIKLTVVE